MPVLFFFIERFNGTEIGLLEGYIKFYKTINWTKYLFSVFFLAIALELIYLFSQYIYKRLELRRSLVLIVSIISLAVLDLLLEHPSFLGFDILFPKTLDTKFVYTSNDFHNTLTASDKFEIYNLLINESSPYFILDSLSNNAGHRNHNMKYKIALDPEVEKIFQNSWFNKNSESNIISNIQSGLTGYDIVLEGYGGIYRFTPIKKIGNKIMIGYDCFIAPLGSHGSFIEIEKTGNKWTIKNTISTWVS